VEVRTDASTPVVRIWRGRVPAGLASSYLRLMGEVAVPDYRSTPGNRAAFTLHRQEGPLIVVMMVTIWDSIDAIAAFAGPDIEQAKYYPFDSEYLVELEPTVQHYTLANGAGLLAFDDNST
jgi:heme-degrading monooxygenase HmoA